MTSTNRIIPVVRPKVITNDMPYLVRDVGKPGRTFADAEAVRAFLEAAGDKTLWDITSALTETATEIHDIGSSNAGVVRNRALIGNPSDAISYPDSTAYTFVGNRLTTGGTLNAKINALDLVLKRNIIERSRIEAHLGGVMDTPNLELNPPVWETSQLDPAQINLSGGAVSFAPDIPGTTLWSYVKAVKRKLDQFDPSGDIAKIQKLIGPEEYPESAKFSQGEYDRNVFGYLNYLNEETNPLSIRDSSYDLPDTTWHYNEPTPTLTLDIPDVISTNYSDDSGIALRILLKLTLVSQSPTTPSFEYYKIEISQFNIVTFVNTMVPVPLTKE